MDFNLSVYPVSPICYSFFHFFLLAWHNKKKKSYFSAEAPPTCGIFWILLEQLCVGVQYFTINFIYDLLGIGAAL